MGSREWEDYVFSLLYPSEFEEKDGIKYPKSSGLRRLTQKLIGPIVKSGPVSVTQIDNESATVIYELHVLYNTINVTNANQYIREDDFTSASLRVYSAAANVYRGNTPDTFASPVTSKIVLTKTFIRMFLNHSKNSVMLLSSHERKRLRKILRSFLKYISAF